MDAEGYVILFNMDFFLQNNFPHQYITDKRVLLASTRPYIYLSFEQAEEIKGIFETIIAEKFSKNDHKEELIALKVIELLILSERLFAEEQQFDANLPVMDIVKRFTALLEAHFQDERSVGFYAAAFNMHPNYLNSVIKKHTGLTAKECIQNRLLMETKYLLHSTNLSIKEISGQMGFSDPNYFTTFFKKLEKRSPLHYRSSFV
jgi:AraC-like DNA-binding protein